MGTANAAAAGAGAVVLPDSVTPALPYADLPSRWGVSVERFADGIRVVVPPVPSWRQLHAGFFVGGSILAFFIAFTGFIAYQEKDPATLIGNGILYGGGLLWVVLAARYRLRRRIVLEVARDTVSATHVSGRGNGRRVEWPRAKVAEIKLNPTNGKLIIRVAGTDFVELYLGPNVRLNAYVADLLATALHAPVGPATAFGNDDAAAVRPGFDGVRSAPLRRVLVGVAGVMAVAGIVLMFLPLPGPPLGMYLLIFASAPAGIALGTHERDFYA